MTFTNEAMAQSTEVLAALKETGKLGYAVARNLRKLKDECLEYIKLKNDLLVAYGVNDGNGRYTVSGENLQKYREELGDLPTLEANVDIFQVDEETFLSGNMDSSQMEKLLWMIKEG